jgi:hypothetical protein
MFLLIRILRSINEFFIYSLRNPYILYWVVSFRYFYFKLTKGIRTIESPYSVKISNAHNTDGLVNHFKACVYMERFDRLIFSMLANENFKKSSKILIIGPRTEADIFKLKAYGYSNIEAIDLISYSESITLMDCHEMIFPDNTFDAIFCGWVLPYSTNPQKIADNIMRVAKNKSLISIGIEYALHEKLINSVDKVKSFFWDKIDNIFFEEDASSKNKCSKTLLKDTGAFSSQIMISFSLKK